jgi:hypothetical protein
MASRWSSSRQVRPSRTRLPAGGWGPSRLSGSMGRS